MCQASCCSRFFASLAEVDESAVLATRKERGEHRLGETAEADERDARVRKGLEADVVLAMELRCSGCSSNGSSSTAANASTISRSPSI
ncbi:MAG: hypothetical protein H0T09_00980 [Actinobacteria bacterium]|nr:hypothetical protein [Actinomycetota bacterium]